MIEICRQVKDSLKASLENAELNLKKTQSDADRESRRAQRLQDEMLGIKEFSDNRELELQQMAFELEQVKGESEQLRLLIRDNSINMERYVFGGVTALGAMFGRDFDV
uniref:Uncharacterized protein n=1 Tax=Spongospora subterranea TaxID=70186 RepID=A0A0H5QIC3_9EUKA|eukprot:CRZ01076.1 hypothetical protein [Spongospora subterranea]